MTEIMDNYEPIYDLMFDLSEYIESGYKNWGKFADSKNLTTSQAGVYYLFNKKGNLLWIGYSGNLKDRLRVHVTKNVNNVFPYTEVYNIAVLYGINASKLRESIPDCWDIEYYLIDKLKPKYNRHRWNWRTSKRKPCNW